MSDSLFPQFVQSDPIAGSSFELPEGPAVTEPFLQEFEPAPQSEVAPEIKKKHFIWMSDPTPIPLSLVLLFPVFNDNFIKYILYFFLS